MQQLLAVVPHAGTWIEICVQILTGSVTVSFPTRERGLKWLIRRKRNGNCVVPHAGTWIEILCLIGTIAPDTVVPHAGTWIEISETTAHVNFD